MLRKISIVALIACAGFALTACNTVRGLGQDIESVANTGDDLT